MILKFIKLEPVSDGETIYITLLNNTLVTGEDHG
jgi:hypothetical protein